MSAAVAATGKGVPSNTAQAGEDLATAVWLTVTVDAAIDRHGLRRNRLLKYGKYLPNAVSFADIEIVCDDEATLCGF